MSTEDLISLNTLQGDSSTVTAADDDEFWRLIGLDPSTIPAGGTSPTNAEIEESIGLGSQGSSIWKNVLRAVLGTQGANGTGAGLALGLGALAAALTQNKAPAVKQPEYKAAPVYSRALTAPMFPPQPAPQKSASGQNIYTPMKGMPLFFNPNPFQFDSTEAAKRYGPTPQQIAQGQAGYEAGLASLYKPMSISPITFQGATGTTTGGTTGTTTGTPTGTATGGATTTTGGTTGGTTGTTATTGGTTNQTAQTATSAPSVTEQIANTSSTMGSTIRSQLGFDPVTGKQITGNEPDISPVVNTTQTSSVAAIPNKQDQQMAAYQAALQAQQAGLQLQAEAQLDKNAPYTSTTVLDFDEFGTPYYRSQTTQELTAAGKDPTGMERLEQGQIVWGPTTSIYGTSTKAATGGSIDDILVGYGGGELNYNEGGDVYAAAGRYLEGPGDGMSDSITAQIDHGGGKTQPARLARGEFVVPADVVSDLGNGSSNAGAQKLYDMMKKIRKARHGTSKQPPAVKTDRAMPA